MRIEDQVSHSFSKPDTSAAQRFNIKPHDLQAYQGYPHMEYLSVPDQYWVPSANADRRAQSMGSLLLCGKQSCCARSQQVPSISRKELVENLPGVLWEQLAPTRMLSQSHIKQNISVSCIIGTTSLCDQQSFCLQSVR